MAGNNDIQSEMSTKITVDAQQAGEQVKNLSDKFKDLTASWKAEEAVAKANGDSVGATKARYEGLTKSLEVQKEKVEALKHEREALKSEMESSSTVTKEQTDDLKDLDRQLASAAERVTSLSNQQRRAKNSYDYTKSGLRELKNEYYNNNRAIDSNVEKLKAEGQTAEAQKAKLTGLKISLENLNKQQEAAKKLADEAAKSEGSNSNLYKRRITDYNEISAAIAKTKRETDQLDASLIKSSNVSVSGLTRVRDRFLGIYQSEVKATAQAKTMGDVFRGSFMGTFASNIAQNAIMSLTSKMHDLIAAGKQFNVEQDTMKTVWHSLTTQAPRDGQKLLNFINSLSQHSIYSAETINRMAQSFYHVDSSVKHTKEWTNDFIRLGSTMHMTNDQLAEAGEQFAKIVAGGKASQEDMNVMINRFPMFGEALQKATGKSMKQLQQLSQQGKLTSQDFVKAMDYLGKKYKSGQSEAMTSYMGMSMYLRSRFSKLAGDVEKSNFRMSKSAKNAMVQVTSDHAMEQYAKAISSALAGLAGALSKTIVWIHKHQTATKALISVTAGLVIFHKVARWVTGFYGLIGRLIIAYKGYTDATRSAMVAQKMLNLAMKSNVILLVVSAIAALVAALVALYKHNKKFRSFVNGIGRDLKKFGKGFIDTGKSILKGADNLHKKLSRGWNNYWKEQARKQRAQQKQEARYQAQRRKQDQQAWNAMKRNAARGWKSMERSASNGVKRVGKWYTNMSRTTGRAVQNMAKQHPRTFGNMYKVIQDRTRIWHDLVTGHWSRLKNDTGRLAKDQSRANNDIFEDMYSSINKKTGGWLGKVVDSWKDHMSQIGDAISAGKRKAGQAMADLANGVLKPFKTLIDDIQGGINWVLDKIGASKLGGPWSAAIPTFATGTAGNRDGLKKSTIGMVNDGAGSHWRELYSYKGQVGAFPNKRNFITFLPKGMSILNGEDSHKLMSAIGLPKFADGVGDFFDSIEKGAADAGDFIDKVIDHPIQALEDVFKKFVKLSTPIKFAASLVTNVPTYIAKQAGNWIKKQFEELADPGGSGVERWRPYVVKALAMLHLSSSLVGKVLRQIQTESGGNPKAMGGTDGLADGHAEGLMQVKPGTFAANKLPGHGNIWNGFDNLLAGLNYARKRYGDSLYFLGQGHGYANGGLVNVESLARVAEGNHPEMIIPMDIAKRGRAYQLLSEVMAQFKHEDGPAQTTRSDQSITKKEFMSLESRLDKVVGLLAQIAGLSSDQVQAIKDQGTFDTKQFYKKEARDARMRAFG